MGARRPRSALLSSYREVVPWRVSTRRAKLGLSRADVERRMRELLQRGGFPSEGWLAKVEKGTNRLFLADAMALAKALETSVGYLCGETDYIIEGWDDLPESSKNLFRRMIKESAEPFRIAGDEGRAGEEDAGSVNGEAGLA